MQRQTDKPDLPLQHREAVIARARAMPWNEMVDLLKGTVRRYHRTPIELPPIIAEWVDLNSQARGEDEAAELAKAAELVSRMEKLAASAYPALRDFTQSQEHSPIGKTWWVAVHRYLRDGKVWWLLRAYLEGHPDDVESATTDIQRRELARIVGRFGGNAKRPLVSGGRELVFTWKD